MKNYKIGKKDLEKNQKIDKHKQKVIKNQLIIMD